MDFISHQTHFLPMVSWHQLHSTQTNAKSNTKFVYQVIAKEMCEKKREETKEKRRK